MFLNNWSNLAEMAEDFNLEEKALNGVNVLLASYGTQDYEGSAFVLFERSGKLYEVNGDHCSCYGLEGQWEPEETSVAALLHRLDEGCLGASAYDDNPFAEELRQVLAALPAYLKA